MDSKSHNKSPDFREWMVPPIIVPIALALLIALWVVLRPYVG